MQQTRLISQTRQSRRRRPNQHPISHLQTTNPKALHPHLQLQHRHTSHKPSPKSTSPTSHSHHSTQISPHSPRHSPKNHLYTQHSTLTSNRPPHTTMLSTKRPSQHSRQPITHSQQSHPSHRRQHHSLRRIPTTNANPQQIPIRRLQLTIIKLRHTPSPSLRLSRPPQCNLPNGHLNHHTNTNHSSPTSRQTHSLSPLTPTPRPRIMAQANAPGP